jgi:PX domain
LSFIWQELTYDSQLRKAYPEFEIRPPPPKDRTAVSLASQPPSTAASAPASRAATPGPFQQEREAIQRSNTAASSSDDLTARPSASSINASSLAREKNRVTLRSYLHGLLASSVIANSPVLKSFLLSGPTTLSEEEEEDARRREDADRLREEGRKRFAAEVAARVDGLRTAVRSVKGDMMGKSEFL